MFSVGLGLVELAAPRLLARVIGVDPEGRTALAVRALGVREVVSGIGILARPRRALPLWARVAGDVMDLGLLAWAMKSKRTSAERIGVALVAVAGATALDVLASRRAALLRGPKPPVIFSVTINKPPAAVYAFWRTLENLPQFMDYLESVRELGDGTSRWIAKLPVKGTVEWTAELVEDVPGEVIAWRTTGGTPFTHEGRVTFARAPGREMTEVRVEVKLGIAGSAPSAALAKLLTKPQIKGDLRRFKQVMETGEVLFSDASVHRGPHPAQPAAELPAKKGLR